MATEPFYHAAYCTRSLHNKYGIAAELKKKFEKKACPIVVQPVYISRRNHKKSWRHTVHPPNGDAQMFRFLLPKLFSLAEQHLKIFLRGSYLPFRHAYMLLLNGQTHSCYPAPLSSRPAPIFSQQELALWNMLLFFSNRADCPVGCWFLNCFISLYFYHYWSCADI